MSAPRLDFDWEEGVFRGLLSLWHRVKPAAAATDAAAAELEDCRRAITTLAQLIAAEPVRVIPGRGAGGVRGSDLLLPVALALAPNAAANRELYVVRAVVSAAMRRCSRGRAAQFSGALAPLESLRLARESVEWASETFPRFAEIHADAVRLALSARPNPQRLRGRERVLEEARQDALRGGRPWDVAETRRALEASRGGGRLSPEVPIWGAYMESLAEPEAAATPDERPPGRDAETEAQAPAVGELQRVKLDEREKEDAVLIHTFEKVDTLDQYRGGARDTDGADELDAQLDALSEVDLGDLVRGEDAAHSILNADIQLGADVPDVEHIGPDERGVPYDEWDARGRRYRRNWCTVYPARMHATDASWAAAAIVRQRRLIRDLRRRLEIHRAGLRPIARQLDGEDIDLAALVDSQGAQRAGRGADARVYVRQAKRRRDYATTVLLDVSLSSDSWVDGHRVLDVARDAVLVLGEVADELGDRLQVLAFASHTRNRCRVWEVRGWRDSWALGRARLGALEPQGYTRIGPALRHATRGLACEPADRRLLLLVSDGKPTDYDRYEGRYGIGDVRQALREAARAGVYAHALAVDAVARDALPPMFGPGGWHILPHPDALPEALTEVYGRLTAA